MQWLACAVAACCLGLCASDAGNPPRRGLRQSLNLPLRRRTVSLDQIATQLHFSGSATAAAAAPAPAAALAAAAGPLPTDLPSIAYRFMGLQVQMRDMGQDIAQFEQNMTLENLNFQGAAYNNSSTETLMNAALNKSMINQKITFDLEKNATQAFTEVDKANNRMKSLRKTVTALYDTTREITTKSAELKMKVSLLSNETKRILPGVDTVVKRMAATQATIKSYHVVAQGQMGVLVDKDLRATFKRYGNALKLLAAENRAVKR